MPSDMASWSRYEYWKLNLNYTIQCARRVSINCQWMEFVALSNVDFDVAHLFRFFLRAVDKLDAQGEQSGHAREPSIGGLALIIMSRVLRSTKIPLI